MGRVWLDIFYPLEGNNYSKQHIISCHIFSVQYPKRNHKSFHWGIIDLLGLNIPRGTKTAFLTPKRYDVRRALLSRFRVSLTWFFCAIIFSGSPRSGKTFFWLDWYVCFTCLALKLFVCFPLSCVSGRNHHWTLTSRNVMRVTQDCWLGLERDFMQDGVEFWRYTYTLGTADFHPCQQASCAYQ